MIGFDHAKQITVVTVNREQQHKMTRLTTVALIFAKRLTAVTLQLGKGESSLVR